ncbi:MAG TPA: formylglycine-generating enzyme family protein [Vicinamibacterales bacterium]|nr:formylglycine-generating enzyme family protein [Vicinamibacterales bacterium]
MTRYLILVTALVMSVLGLSSGHLRAADKTSKAPAPGSAFKDCRNCPEMVVVPAGSFMMGSPSTEAGRRDNEPQSRVTIARAFAVSRTEVTWDQWEACVRARGCDGLAVEAALRLKNDGSPNPDFVDWGRGTRPVVGVSWYDAQAYVGWLNEKTGLDDRYRLLSDAEWEYAARAGSTTAYPWGDKLDHNYGNFGKEEPGLGGKAEGRDTWLDQTAPVASFAPNAFGLHDMHGNAFEWIEDCHEPDRAHQPADGSANKQGSCRTRMFRSGSFVSNPSMHRSAKRTAPYPPQTRGRNYLTIRVAKTLE